MRTSNHEPGLAVFEAVFVKKPVNLQTSCHRHCQRYPTSSVSCFVQKIRALHKLHTYPHTYPSPLSHAHAHHLTPLKQHLPLLPLLLPRTRLLRFLNRNNSRRLARTRTRTRTRSASTRPRTHRRTSARAVLPENARTGISRGENGGSGFPARRQGGERRSGRSRRCSRGRGTASASSALRERAS